MEVEFELDILLAVESDNDPENVRVLARGDLRTSFTMNVIANVTGGGAGMWSVLHINCRLYSIFKSCKLCCKCTVHCKINFEGTVCIMQDSLSCLPRAYNTYMYVHA